MGAIAGAAIGAAGDIAASGMQTTASIMNTNNTNKTNLQIAQDTNKTNAQNVAATNEANKAIADKTNQMNFEIAQMGNEYNQHMLEQQLQQEWDMWNAENEYNSIGSQMERAKEAGVNPYVATGLISPGTAGSMHVPTPQGAITPTMEGATMQAAEAKAATMMPTDFSSLQGLRGVAANFVNLLRAQEDIKGQQLDNAGKEIENSYKADMFMVEMYKRMQDAGLTKSQRKGLDIENKFKSDLLSSELKQRDADTRFTQLQSIGQLYANLSSMEWYKVLPQQIQQTVNEQAARIANMRMQGKLTEAQVHTEVNRAVTEFYNSMSSKSNADFQGQTFENRKNLIVRELERAINNAGPDGIMGLPNIFYNGFRQIGSWFDK